MRKQQLITLCFLVMMTIIFHTKTFAKEIASKEQLIELFSKDPKQENSRPSIVSELPDGGHLFLKSDILDTADTVQTDGDYIYYIAENILYLVDTKDPSKILKQQDLTTDNIYSTKLYLDKQSKTLTLFARNKVQRYTDNITDYVRNRFVKVIVFDLNLNKLRTFSIEGFLSNITTSGDNIYLITQNYIKGYDGKESLPTYYDSVTKNYTEIGFDRFYSYKTNNNRLLNIASINIKDLSKPATITTYLGEFKGTYAELDNLYLISPKQLIKFNLNKDNINIVSTTDTKDADFLNNFELNIHNNYFRLSNRDYLYIYDKDFNLVSKTKIIFSNSLFYSIKFIGYNMFVQDGINLCIVNTKDPTKPTIKTNIEVPAYQVFYEPYDENHVLAMVINPEAKVGLKYVLYDISDPKNPKEKFSKVLGDVGSYPEFMYSEGSFLLNKEKNILAMSVILTKKPYSDDGKFIGTAIYNLDLKNGFTEKALLPYSSSRIVNIEDNLYMLSNNQIKKYNLK